MILKDVCNTTHADSLALFALNIEILLADVTKPKKTNILTLSFDLTCDVISDLRVKLLTLYGRFTYRAIEWRLKFGNQSSSLGDLRAFGPPPAGRVTNQTPAGRGLSVVGMQIN